MDDVENRMKYAFTRNKQADRTFNWRVIFLFLAVFADCTLEYWIFLALHVLMFEVNLEACRRRRESFKSLIAAYERLREYRRPLYEAQVDRIIKGN